VIDDGENEMIPPTIIASETHRELSKHLHEDYKRLPVYTQIETPFNINAFCAENDGKLQRLRTKLNLMVDVLEEWNERKSLSKTPIRKGDIQELLKILTLGH
jgi:hypothetical protein